MKTVLFVCVHNSGRSQMAEAFTNHKSAQLGLDIRAKCAGTVGGNALNPVAIEAMKEIGISMDGQTPKLMTQEMVKEASSIISMGCGVDADACPTKFILTEDWGLDDHAGQPIEAVRKIRDQISDRVEELIQRLTQR